MVTDPDGYTISVDTVIYTQEEALHEIPGILYYVQDDIDGDVVFAPTLKPGVYTIRAVPKQGAPPDATFGVDMAGSGYFLQLAADVPIKNIPPEGYGVRSTGEIITLVNPDLIATSTALESSPNPAEVRRSVTFTATVTSANGTPSGNLAFKEAGNVLATVMLDQNGVAIFQTSSLAIGAHSILAEYRGDGTTFSGSISNTVVQQIGTANTQAAPNSAGAAHSTPSHHTRAASTFATAYSEGATNSAASPDPATHSIVASPYAGASSKSLTIIDAIVLNVRPCKNYRGVDLISDMLWPRGWSMANWMRLSCGPRNHVSPFGLPSRQWNAV